MFSSDVIPPSLVLAHTEPNPVAFDQALTLIRAVLVAKNRQIALRLAQGKDLKAPHGTSRRARIPGNGSPTLLSWAESVGHLCSYSDSCGASW